jgi:hypothetical protein
MRRIFWAKLVHDWTQIAKYKRKCYSSQIPKVFVSKHAVSICFNITDFVSIEII